MTTKDEAILSIDTLMHYGLKQQPFSAQAPDAFIYADPALDMPVSAILDYLLTEEHLIVLKGEYGIGKSTHIKKLLSKARGSLNACLFEATVSSSLAGIEHCMRSCWSQDDSPQELLEFVCDLLRKGMRPALIIDDAHELDADVMEQVLMLRLAAREATGKTLGVVLVAESSIEHTLSNLEADIPEITQAHSLHLRPLTREQAAAYLDHRLRIAGLYAANPYSDSDISRITQQSGGLPGRLNPLATAKLEQFGQTHIKKERALRPGWLHNNRIAITAILLILIVFGALYALLQGFFSTEEGVEEKQVERLALPTPEKKPLQSKPQAEPAPVKKKTEPAPEPITAAVLQPVEEAKPPVVAAKSIEEPPTAKPKPEVETQPVAPKPAAPAEKKKTERPSPPTASSSLKDPSWVLKQDPTHFAIQLLASSALQSVQDFSRELELGNPLAYYQRKVDGKTLYILIAAPYSDRDAASEAIKGFPASLRRNSPWIRPLKDIQDSIYAQ